MKRAFLIAAATVLGVTVFVPSIVLAQPWPAKPITLVVGSPPGSATDNVSRRFAEYLRAKHTTAVVIDNRPGADGNIAAQTTLRAPADGYTVFMTGNSVHGANANLYKELPFDPINDFEMIGGATASPLVLAVRTDFPANTVGEFIAEAKRRDKGAFYGTSGASTLGASVLFQQRTRLHMENVPYKGSPQVITDLIAGQFDFAFIDINTVRPFIQEGRLKGLAISSAKRHPALRNIPAIAETLPDFEFRAWIGVVVRAKTPPEAVTKLGTMLHEFVSDPATVRYIEGLGSHPLLLDAKPFKRFVEAEKKMWAGIVRAGNIEQK